MAKVPTSGKAKSKKSQERFRLRPTTRG